MITFRWSEKDENQENLKPKSRFAGLGGLKQSTKEMPLK